MLARVTVAAARIADLAGLALKKVYRPLFSGTAAPLASRHRERDRKTPTAAHYAIADLVRGGHVRVLITTNFDRLMENALRDQCLAQDIAFLFKEWGDALAHHAHGVHRVDHRFDVGLQPTAFGEADHLRNTGPDGQRF